MTRWLTPGLLIVCAIAAKAQTADVITEVVGFERPIRVNPFGGGSVELPSFPIAAQQKLAPPAQPPGLGQPVPPTTSPGGRRSLRSTTIPAGPPKLDLHGDPLPPRAVARYGTIRLRHGTEVLGLGFSQDGKFLGSISNTEDGIRLWDPKTGKELYRLNSPAWTAAFARDGSILIMDQNRFKVWIPTANSIRDLPEKTLAEPAQAIAVHPDCRSFAAGVQRKILLLDLQTGKLIRELKCPGEQPPTRLVFSPDGRWLAGVAQKTGVWLWDLRTGKRARTYHSEFDFPEFTFNSDGTRIAIAAEQLRIFPTDSEEMIENYKSPEGFMQNPRFSKDGKFVFGISPEGNFRQIDALSGEVKEPGNSLEVALRPPMAVAPEGAFAAALDQTGGIRIWDPKTGDEPDIDRLPLLSDPGFSADGKTLWCLASDGKVHAFDTASGKKIKDVELPIDENVQVWWDPRTRQALAAVGGEETELQVIDVDAKRIVHKIASTGAGIISTVAFCTTERNRAAVFGQGSVSVIDLKTGKQVRNIAYSKLNEDAPPAMGAISPDGRLVAIGTHPLSIWEVSSGKKRFDFDAMANATGATFSSDGRYLAGWDAIGNIVVFDVRLGTIVRRLQGEASPESNLVLSFSADGKRLAAGDGDGGITIWDLATGDILSTLDRHDGYVTGLAFSADGTKVASTSQDGTVLVWEVSGKIQGEKAPDAAIGGLEEAFRLLLSAEASQAQRGMEYLYRRPVETTKLCADRITVPTAIPADKIAKLIADLESEDFPDRQAAVKSLEAAGGEAIAALRIVAEKSSNAEARKLAGEILVRSEATPPKGDDLRLVRVVELLENIGTPEARTLLAKWTQGPSGHRLSIEASAAIVRLKPLEK